MLAMQESNVQVPWMAIREVKSLFCQQHVLRTWELNVKRWKAWPLMTVESEPPVLDLS